MTETDLSVADAIGAGTPPRRRRLRITGAGAIGLAITLFWLVLAVIGPMIAPHGVGAVVDQDVFGGISRKFPLGTDYLGRDMLSRILYAARYTIGVALASTGLACAAGVSFGRGAAVIGGWFDLVISRFFDALISIPSLMFGLVVVAALGSALPVLILTMAVIYTPGCYRIARSLAVNINAMDFVQVAKARGEGMGYVMFHEILPNALGPILADFGLRFVYVVLLLSGLSFLGLGVQPPEADLGSLVRENISGLAFGAPAVIMPALAIGVLTVGVNMLIDNLPGRRRLPGRGA